MRLWWISAAALVVVVSFGCFFGTSESAENGYVEAKDFRTGSGSGSSENSNKVTIRRRLIRRKLDSASGESKENATVSMRVSTSSKDPEPSTEDTSQPKSTTFTQARRALFNRLNKPLLKNRSLDSTISKLRSRLGAVSSESTTSKPRYFKKVLKKVNPAKRESNEKSEETSPISIQVPTDKPKRNDSMIMIPVPESQRKPYQPVIMQVSKSNESSTASPDTKVVTYKLNKMFVPMGIYGRVVHDSENATATTDSQEVKGPEVRHKGTQSESKERSSGVKVSEGSDEKWEHLMKEIKSKNKKTRKQKEHSSIADTIDITYNYRPKYDQISITTPQTDAARVAITTDKPMFNANQVSLTVEQGNANRRTSSWGPSSNSNKKSSGNKMTMMSPPGPMRKDSTSSSSNLGFLDTLKQTVSNIPGVFHKGFTSLTSITNSYSENPFHDDTFASGSETRPTGSKKQTILGAIPGGYIPKNNNKKPTAQMSASSTLSDYETLEYFRNRPHLFGRQNRFKESKSISGFKPVTAPAHMAQEYFGSTPTRASSTTPSPRQADSYSSASQEILKASPSAWKVVSSEVSSGVPTEELNTSWKDYLFQANEYGTEPGSSRTWRSMLGLGPAVEESSMMSPTFGNRFHMLDGGRRRSMLLDDQWKDITNKYTKTEIDEAKERIYEVFSGPQPRSDDEVNIMRPPSPRVGGAFEDLMKMFKLWFNVGHGKSISPLKSFDHIKSESSRSSEDSWTPIAKVGGKPLISFSAGISFPTKNPSHPHSHPPSHHGHGTHFSASPKPFIPSKFNKGGLTNHITTLAHNYGGPTKPTSFSEFGKPSHYTSYSTEGDSPYGSHMEDELEQPEGEDHYPIGSSSSHISKHASGFGSHFAKGSLKDVTLNSDPLRESASTSYATSAGGSPYSVPGDDSPYELVPSDVYFSQKNPDLGEIAAVVKPEGITDDELKAQLPSQVAGVPTLNYPPEYHLNKNPQHSFNSLNHLQQYLSTSDGKPLNAAHNKQIADKYKAKEQSFMLPQKFYDAQYSQSSKTGSYLTSNNFGHQRQPTAQTIQAKLNPQTYQSLQYQQQLQQSIYKPQQPYIQYSEGQISGSRQGLGGQIIQQQTRPKSSGDSGLGFSDFNLPPNMDPDIAALLKAELDKDDVPEVIRKEFQAAKKEEAEKQQKQQQSLRQHQSHQAEVGGQSSRRSDFVSQQQSHYPSFAQSTRPFNTASNFNFQTNQNKFYNLQHLQQQQQLQQQRPQQQARPSYHQHHFNGRPNPNPIPFVPSNRRQSQVVSKFFAPIPISPTHITQTLRGRYQSPVPRYVVELAKKLQRDKDVQGIVRVSTKRGSGPPIEYLYPVRG